MLLISILTLNITHQNDIYVSRSPAEPRASGRQKSYLHTFDILAFSTMPGRGKLLNNLMFIELIL